jgi:large subunit ribosomal protein L46
VFSFFLAVNNVTFGQSHDGLHLAMNWRVTSHERNLGTSGSCRTTFFSGKLARTSHLSRDLIHPAASSLHPIKTAMNAGLRCARQPFGLLLSTSPRAPRNASRQPANAPSEQHPRAALYSTAPTTVASTPAADGFVPTAPTQPSKTSPYNIASGVVLSRPPTLTRPLTEFEESFYFYQRRLNQRLALPFTRYFYFKKDTPADAEWKRKQKALGPQWTGFGTDGWKDELLVGDDSHKSPDNGYRRLVESTVTGEDGEDVPEEEKRFEAPLERTTKADLENDRRSLDRKGERTLYLLVKSKAEKYAWRFPQAGLVGRETLREVGFKDS